jgi:hypothetical protein
MELFQNIVSIIEEAGLDAEKFYDKGNKAAGVRLRKAMQDLKKLAQDVRLDVAAKNKAE